MRRIKGHTLGFALVAVAALASISCGGGGGNVPGGGGGNNLTAAFTASNPTPGANSISMAAGPANGATFQIVVNATDITNFFGTGFRIAFNDVSAEFLSFDPSGSWLNTLALPAGVTVNINAAVDSSDAGMVVVVATLQGMSAGMTVPGTQELLTLTFRATSSTAGNAFTFDIPSTRAVTTCTTASGACSDIADASLSWNGGMLAAN